MKMPARFIQFLSVVLIVAGLVVLIRKETVEAVTPVSVVINEVAWMGNTVDVNGEWLELYNNSVSGVDLTGWRIAAQDGTPSFTLSGMIPGNGFFLIERSDNNPVFDISADFIYTGALENTDEILELYDGSNVLMDTVNSNGGDWPGGNNTTKTTMERIDPLAEDTDTIWGSNDGVTKNGVVLDGSSPIFGTPKMQNSIFGVPLTPTPTGEPSPTPTGEPTPTPTDGPIPTPTGEPVSSIKISELMIAGETTTDEVVEVYNPTDVDIAITGWALIKKTATGTPSDLVNEFADLTIPSHKYLLVAHPDYDSTDEVVVMAIDGVTADVYYSTSASLAINNTVLLVDGSAQVIDKVGLGTAIDVETAAIANPGTSASVERKANSGSTEETMIPGGADELAGNSWDTNNNSSDFVVRDSPQPQNLTSPAEPVGVIPTPTETPSPTPTEEPTPTPTGEPTPGEEQVVINEVAWAGSTASAGDEWIELYNTSGNVVDIIGWTLEALDGSTPIISLTGSIPAGGYFLLERSNDDTVKDIAANQIYGGALSNSGGGLELKNISLELIDSANGDSGEWPGGNNTTKATMERIDPLADDTDANWGTNDGIIINGLAADGSSPIIGTPKSQNSMFGVSPSPTPTEGPSPTPTEEPTPTPTEEPSPTPTEEPTPTPTEEPSPTPTAEPTPTLTEAPLPTPTEEPEPTPTPTEQPSPTPTPLPGNARTYFSTMGVTCAIQKSSISLGGINFKTPKLVCVTDSGVSLFNNSW